MVQITSGSVLAMQDSAFADILNEINIRSRQARMSVILGFVAALVCTALIINLGAILAPSLLLVAAAAGFGAWLDSYKRVVVLFYDEEALSSFQQICAAFDGLAACAGKWHVRAAKPVYDLTTWKRQAGASTIVNRTPAVLGYQLPSVIKSNITPPILQIGSRTLYLLPDVILVRDGNLFGSISYASISLRSQQSNFVEEGVVPGDTEVLYYT